MHPNALQQDSVTEWAKACILQAVGSELISWSAPGLSAMLLGCLLSPTFLGLHSLTPADSRLLALQAKVSATQGTLLLLLLLGLTPCLMSGQNSALSNEAHAMFDPAMSRGCWRQWLLQTPAWCRACSHSLHSSSARCWDTRAWHLRAGWGKHRQESCRPWELWQNCGCLMVNACCSQMSEPASLNGATPCLSQRMGLFGQAGRTCKALLVHRSITG